MKTKIKKIERQTVKIYRFADILPEHKQRVMVGTNCGAEIPAIYFRNKNEFRIMRSNEVFEGDIIVWCALPSLEEAIDAVRNELAENKGEGNK